MAGNFENNDFVLVSRDLLKNITSSGESNKKEKDFDTKIYWKLHNS